jgi:hypothetical protein
MIRRALLIAAASVWAVSAALANEQAAPRCERPDSPPRQQVATISGDVVENVLCCCPTYGGGQCCKYVGYCGGNFVPGCMCSMAKPEPRD